MGDDETGFKHKLYTGHKLFYELVFRLVFFSSAKHTYHTQVLVTHTRTLTHTQTICDTDGS